MPPPLSAPEGARIINQRAVGFLRMAERHSWDAGKRVRASSASARVTWERRADGDIRPYVSSLFGKRIS